MQDWLERIAQARRRVVAGLAAVAVLAGAAPALALDTQRPALQAEQVPAPRPALWLLADEDTKIYLFGTVHVLPPELRWRSAALERAIDEADELVLEVSDRETLEDPSALAASILMGKNVSILSRVSPDRRAALAELIALSGLPVEAYDRMHSWAAAITLAAAMVAQAYGGGESGTELSGVEPVLEAEFARRGKPVSGVETAAEQMGFLAGLTVGAQRDFLESIVDDYRFAMAAPDGEEPAEPRLAEREWLEGDVDSLAAETQGMPPPLYEALLTRRNRAWTEWLERRLERPGTVLFAVGAAHLAGRDSVQAMLAERGLTVRRID